MLQIFSHMIIMLDYIFCYADTLNFIESILSFLFLVICGFVSWFESHVSIIEPMYSSTIVRVCLCMCVYFVSKCHLLGIILVLGLRNKLNLFTFKWLTPECVYVWKMWGDKKARDVIQLFSLIFFPLMIFMLKKAL